MIIVGQQVDPKVIKQWFVTKIDADRLARVGIDDNGVFAAVHNGAQVKTIAMTHEAAYALASAIFGGLEETGRI